MSPKVYKSHQKFQHHLSLPLSIDSDVLLQIPKGQKHLTNIRENWFLARKTALSSFEMQIRIFNSFQSTISKLDLNLKGCRKLRNFKDEKVK